MKIHLAQLYRYFSVTSAKFSLLTNARNFNFYTDLEETNKLDTIPFLSFEISDLHPQIHVELKRFSREEFDPENIRASASRLKYISSIKRRIDQTFDNLGEDIVRPLSVGLYEGKFTAAVLERFTPLVKAAFRELIRDSVQSRLTSALADTAHVEEITEDPESEEAIETTPEEIEGFLIVKSIVREVIKPARIFIRDQKSYCGILVDNNNRKPLARLHFNRATKYLGLFDTGREERVKIDSLDNIYDLSDRLRASAKAYVEGAQIAQAMANALKEPSPLSGPASTGESTDS